MLTLLSCCISSRYAPIDGLPQDGGGGVGGVTQGKFWHFRFSNVNFPTIRSPLEVKLCCCRKYPYPSHGRFFLYWNLNLNLKTTWWYNWLISQARLLLVEIGKLSLLKLCFMKCSCSHASLSTVLRGVYSIIQLGSDIHYNGRPL